jgi:(E)-4-hydroxy-3-methylbut-2-enyl-diphosphate synthase
MFSAFSGAKPMARTVTIAGLQIGGSNPVRVESMLKIPLSFREECLQQCISLASCGCELIRAAFPSMELAGDLEWLNHRSPVPLMADIHFDPSLAIGALEAGTPSIRINPGNMPRARIRDVVSSAKGKKAVIRIGANGGSLNAGQLEKAGGIRSDALAAAVEEQLLILLDEGFEDIILSAKSTSVQETVRGNSLLAQKYPDYPFHIGITESGYGRDGLVKSASGLALLLAQGIGNTIRISLTESPLEEVRAGYSLLRSLDLRQRGGSLISCPTCGRKRIDVRKIIDLVLPCLESLPDGVKVAVMGCEVNGPREAMDADFGIAGSPGGAVVFSKGKVLKEVPLEQIPEFLARMAEEACRAEKTNRNE